jgi:RNA polymerase sigma-70 factor (ECF subfamily)
LHPRRQRRGGRVRPAVHQRGRLARPHAHVGGDRGEIKQLRQRLFVAASGLPRIAEYSGRSGLRRWVRSVAVRTGLNFLRQGRREILVEDDRVLDGVAATEDPEIAYMKEKYRREFREAFLAALAGLQPRQQGLLRYHYVDGLNIDGIGTIYRVTG